MSKYKGLGIFRDSSDELVRGIPTGYFIAPVTHV